MALVQQQHFVVEQQCCLQTQSAIVVANLDGPQSTIDRKLITGAVTLKQCPCNPTAMRLVSLT